ncbi:hypothetical protein ACLOJK_011618 [Asimina triloba]
MDGTRRRRKDGRRRTGVDPTILPLYTIGGESLMTFFNWRLRYWGLQLPLLNTPCIMLLQCYATISPKSIGDRTPDRSACTPYWGAHVQPYLCRTVAPPVLTLSSSQYIMPQATPIVSMVFFNGQQWWTTSCSSSMADSTSSQSLPSSIQADAVQHQWPGSMRSDPGQQLRPNPDGLKTHLAIHTPSTGSKPATHQLRPLAPATIHHEPTPSRSVRRRPSSTPDPAGATTDVSSATARWGSDYHLPCHLSSSYLAGKITLRRDRLLLKSSSVWQPNNTSGDGVVCLLAAPTFFFSFSPTGASNGAGKMDGTRRRRTGVDLTVGDIVKEYYHHSFIKQFYASVTKSDYMTLRLGFIMVQFMQENANLFCCLINTLLLFFVQLLLAVGTKLEHVIIQLAHEVAEKHTAIEGDLIVQPSDDHFWLNRPKIVLYLIHFILFQNAFEIAFFFWILLLIKIIVPCRRHTALILASWDKSVTLCLGFYSTLPLYAIVTQMGSSFKKAIFDEHVQEGLVGWAQEVKKRKGAGTKVVNTRNSSSHVGSSDGSSLGIQLQNVGQRQSTIEEGTIHPSAASKSA